MDEPAVVNEDSGSAQRPDAEPTASDQTAQLPLEDSSNNDSKPSNAFNDLTVSMSRLSTDSAPFTSRLHSTQYCPQATYPAQYAAFTQPLMSLEFSQQSSVRPRTPKRHGSRQSWSTPRKSTPATTSQPAYYVDTFQSNFSDRASPSTTATVKPKGKHVTFHEPASPNGSMNNTVMSNAYPSPTASFGWKQPMNTHHSTHYLRQPYYPSQQYSYHGFVPSHTRPMLYPQYTPRPHRAIYTMPMPYEWPQPFYSPDQYPSFTPQSYAYKQLYDPNKPKGSSTPESHPAPTVTRSVTPKSKRKAKQTDTIEATAPSHPITILRKPCAEPSDLSPVNETSASTSTDAKVVPQQELTPIALLDSHKLLSIVQSANCIAALNEFAQQNKLTVSYEFSSTPSTTFTCSISINGRCFGASAPCTTKSDAQKLACDQALRTLYRESTASEQALPECSSKHDYIAHRVLSKFQDLNVSELLLGRKTLASMVMVTDGRFEQAAVISIGTGNGCLDDTSLSYATDGIALHDCHAEVLARRGLIRFLFEQIKQCKDDPSSIFQYQSAESKYQLRENVTFHMYISTLPCGSASLKLSSNEMRYKQGHIEGTASASTSSTKYPIKSCSDKICRWNTLGLQGGILINLLTAPIYLATITIGCETTVDCSHVKSSLCERLNEHCDSLLAPYSLHTPDIGYPQMKEFQQERQVAKLQTSAFAWNVTQPDRNELLEPMTGKLKTSRSISTLSKHSLFSDFTQFVHSTPSLAATLSFNTYQQAKQLDPTYTKAKEAVSAAFQAGATETPVSWLSKGDGLEQFSNA